MLICPEHAQIFACEGWGRERIQEAMYSASRMPFRTLMLNKERPAMAASHPELSWMWDHPDLPVPIVEDPGCFEIAVVGSAAGVVRISTGPASPSPCPSRTDANSTDLEADRLRRQGASCRLTANGIDVGRATRSSSMRHHSFGGAHFYLGVSLARLEAQLAITALVQRFPSLRLADEPLE